MKFFEYIKNSGLIIAISAIMLVGTLTACSEKLIGGADGPTAIYSGADNYLEKLYDAKIKYIGDNSGVSKILSLVFVDRKIDNFELKTDDDAPKGIKVNLGFTSDEDTLKEAKAITVLLLCDNCDYVLLSYENEDIEYNRAEIEAKYGIEFKNVTKDFESFSEFYRNISGLSSTVPIENRIGSIIMEQNSKGYLKGECQGEGHIILGSEGGVIAGEDATKPDTSIIYALVSYGEYGFENGNFTKISGSGIIPTRITLDSSGNVTEYLQASDGSDYGPSIKKMFPEGLWERAMANDSADYDLCIKQERVYAEAYLKSIGREAKIGEYSNFEHVLPEMDTNASNELLRLYGDYPDWIGTTEKIEKGVRMVYEKAWDSEKKIVTLKKYEYDTGKILEEAEIDVSSGKLRYIKGTKRN